jgi:opacity protein-like surface antigen
MLTAYVNRKIAPKMIFALLSIYASCSSLAFAQAAPAAAEVKLPLSIGAGFSGYNSDQQKHGYLIGETLWIDYFPSRLPAHLQGIGLEAEARRLGHGQSTFGQSDFRQETVGGGVIYSWPRFRDFRPYGKLLGEYGDSSVQRGNLGRWHDSRTVIVVGGGMEFRVLRSVWMRADYEYQRWPDMIFKYDKPVAAIHPQGFTVGAMYHFSHSH